MTQTGVLPAIRTSVLNVFTSRQGEGVCVGEPQLFVRFGGCNLACNYCDTPESIPSKSGEQLDLENLLARIDRAALEAPGCRTVSLTGGEPLLQVHFLTRLIPHLRQRGFKIYLETNGTLPGALEKVVDQCDWIAMDFKPASAVGRDLWEAHRWFLNRGGNKLFVKLVLTQATTEKEFRQAVELLGSVRPQTTLVLQPATERPSAPSIPMERLAAWWAWAASKLQDVRILPQVHPLWQIP